MTPSTIISECAREFWLDPSEVTGKRRDCDICDARNIAMWILHRVLRMNTERVAKYFGRDRSTVSYAAQRVEMLLQSERSFSARVNRIISRIHEGFFDPGDVAGMTTG